MKKEAKTVKKASTKSSKKSAEKNVLAGNEIFDTLKPNRKKHFGFLYRVCFCVFAFCCFLFAAVFLIFTSIRFESAIYTSYSEKSTLKYRVHLKPNNYYSASVLESTDKINTYIASLIDSIDAIYDYSFDIDDNITMRLSYDIIARLSITDEREENVYFEKDYTILSNKQINVDDAKHASIQENVKIDYDYYNNIATGFRSTYGINSSSNLVVMLNIHKLSEDEKATILNGNSVQQFRIPLSERAININLKYDNLNNNSFVIRDENFNIASNKRLIVGCICIIISLIFAIKVVRMYEKLSPKLSPFDKYVRKLLRTYDRLIVESRNAINLDDYQIIKVNKFEELLDVRDNLKLPINYYVVTPHQKAIFYIVSTNVYMYTVKEVDIKSR